MDRNGKDDVVAASLSRAGMNGADLMPAAASAAAAAGAGAGGRVHNGSGEEKRPLSPPAEPFH